MTSTPPAFAEGDFRKASACHPDRECVCVARGDGWVEIRDDKTAFGTPGDQRLVLPADEFDRFLGGVRSGQITGHCLEITPQADRTYRLRSAISSPTANDAELTFTSAEIAAFLDGVTQGEFDRDTTSDTAYPE